jgi:hypothetical protein
MGCRGDIAGTVTGAALADWAGIPDEVVTALIVGLPSVEVTEVSAAGLDEKVEEVVAGVEMAGVLVVVGGEL